MVLKYCTPCLLYTAVQLLDLDNLFLFNDGTYSGLQAYKNSKLANVLFAYELSRQLDGTGLKVNVVDPGKLVFFLWSLKTCSLHCLVHVKKLDRLIATHSCSCWCDLFKKT